MIGFSSSFAYLFSMIYCFFFCFNNKSLDCLALPRFWATYYFLYWYKFSASRLAILLNVIEFLPWGLPFSKFFLPESSKDVSYYLILGGVLIFDFLSSVFIRLLYFFNVYCISLYISFNINVLSLSLFEGEFESALESRLTLEIISKSSRRGTIPLKLFIINCLNNGSSI